MSPNRFHDTCPSMHVWPKVPRGVIASCLFTLREATHACWFGEVRFDLCSPTKEELEVARTILNSAGEKEVRSKVLSMSSWLKANLCNEASSSRGEDRRRWLEHFLVVQSRTRSNIPRLGLDGQRRNGEHGRDEITFLASVGQASLSKADPVTDSLEEHLLVYRVPRHWERLSHEDFVSPSSSSTTQAGEHDAKMLEDAEVDCADCVGERSLEGQVKGESYSEVSVDCNKDSS